MQSIQEAQGNFDVGVVDPVLSWGISLLPIARMVYIAVGVFIGMFDRSGPARYLFCQLVGERIKNLRNIERDIRCKTHPKDNKQAL